MADVVYFVQSRVPDFRIKIGYTASIQWRLGQIRIDSERPVRLLGVINGGKELEKSLHERFGKHRIYNQHWRTEWFKPAPELIEYINQNAYMPRLSEKNGQRVLQLSPEMMTKVEILAYQQKMTVTELVEWAIERTFGVELNQLELPFEDEE